MGFVKLTLHSPSTRVENSVEENPGQTALPVLIASQCSDGKTVNCDFLLPETKFRPALASPFYSA